MGFTTDWLTLREPADRAARDATLLRRAVAAAGPNPVILDLGCGTGSTVRALRPHVPAGTEWRLVDNDPELLARAEVDAGGLARIFPQDLQALDALPLDGVTLVTASALIDLVSRQWLEDFVARVRVPVYFALSYDGVMTWNPEDPHDAPIVAAFNAHQRGDKGFGQALGPDSVPVTQEIFEHAGFTVAVATSDWRLGPEDALLQRDLVAGIARAAQDVGAEEALEWGVRRSFGADHSSCTVGHGDILAIPTPPAEAGSRALG